MPKTPGSVGARDVQRPTDAPISSPYGWRTIRGNRNFHSGIDFARRNIAGAPVNAAAAGSVVSVGLINRYGTAIVLRHEATPAPLFTLYGHLDRVWVAPGETVREGQQIATVGNTAGTREDPTATTDRPHLHHEMLTRWPPRGIDLDRIDPTPYLAPYTRDASVIELSPTAAGLSVGGFLALGLLYWYSTRGKKTRRSGYYPAAAGPTDAAGEHAYFRD